MAARPRPKLNDPEVLSEAVIRAVKSSAFLGEVVKSHPNAIAELVLAWHQIPAIHMRNLSVCGWQPSDALHDALCRIDAFEALDDAEASWVRVANLKLNTTDGELLLIEGEDWQVKAVNADTLSAFVARDDDVRIAYQQVDGSWSIGHLPRPERWAHDTRIQYAHRVLNLLRPWAPARTPTEQLIANIADAACPDPERFAQSLAELGWNADRRLVVRLSDDDLDIGEDHYNAIAEWVENRDFPRFEPGHVISWMGREWRVQSIDPILGQLTVKDSSGSEYLLAYEDVELVGELVTA